MTTHTFYLQVATIAGRTSHSVALSEEALVKPHANADWQRYKLTVVDGRIESLEKTDRLFKKPMIHTRGDKDPNVSLYKASIVLGAPWESLRSRNPVMLDLIDLMDCTLLIRSSSA